jgi:hypothetical protein
VGDFHSSPIHSQIEVTSGTLALEELDSCQIVLKLLVRGSHCTLCMVCAVDALAVPSDEHTPLSEIVVWLQGSKESSLPGRMT